MWSDKVERKTKQTLNGKREEECKCVKKTKKYHDLGWKHSSLHFAEHATYTKTQTVSQKTREYIIRLPRNESQRLRDDARWQKPTKSLKCTKRKCDSMKLLPRLRTPECVCTGARLHKANHTDRFGCCICNCFENVLMDLHWDFNQRWWDENRIKRTQQKTVLNTCHWKF